MSISIPDKKMDDYARDCVVRLANRVDDKVLRERLLQMAREWKTTAMDEENRSSAATYPVCAGVTQCPTPVSKNPEAEPVKQGRV